MQYDDLRTVICQTENWWEMNKNQILHGDCLPIMCDMPENSVDAIVTDPPYGLEFMGKGWDKLSGAPGYNERGRMTPVSSGLCKNKGFNQIPNSYQAGKPMQDWHYRWAIEALRVAKPGAHMLAFGGTRTHHRLMVAIEDAGWEIRDTMGYLYGSGFPKSLDVSKAIDKAAGVEREVVKTTPSGGYKRQMINNAEQGFRPVDYYPEGNKFTSNESITDAAKQWDGWGTALKPAWEPIILCRKPLSEKTVAENVQKWGTGALNVDACRIGTGGGTTRSCQSDFQSKGIKGQVHATRGYRTGHEVVVINKGRFPANLIHDGSDEVLALFPKTSSGKMMPTKIENGAHGNVYGKHVEYTTMETYGDSGSAARFFYTAKADTTERNKYLKGRPMQKVNDGRDTLIDNPFQRGETLRKNIHPTVKPIDLLQYLARLITPPKGTILDPFAGSGSTGIAAFNEEFNYILIEIEKEYVEIAKIRNAQIGLPT